jgi:hypothetical protein
MLLMLHAMNGVAEMFLTKKDGTKSDLRKPIKLKLSTFSPHIRKST